MKVIALLFLLQFSEQSAQIEIDYNFQTQSGCRIAASVETAKMARKAKEHKLPLERIFFRCIEQEIPEFPPTRSIPN